jgi:hypothetical protein
MGNYYNAVSHTGKSNFSSLVHNLQSCSGAYPAFYLIGAGGFAEGADHSAATGAEVSNEGGGELDLRLLHMFP